MINSSSPALTVKTIDHDSHCYHFYGNNAWTLIVSQHNYKVKKEMCGACVSFEILLEHFFLLKYLLNHYVVGLKILLGQIRFNQNLV